METKAEPPQTSLFLVYQADAQGRRSLQTLPNLKVRVAVSRRAARPSDRTRKALRIAGGVQSERASQTEIYFDDVVAPASLITGLP